MARQGKGNFRFVTIATILFATLLSCALPGTANIYPTQPYEEYTKGYTDDNYVQSNIPTASSIITSTRIVTIVPTNPIIIIESSSTPEQEIILLSNFFVYTIQEGDSFALLARKFCGDEHKYKWLLQVNGMEEGEILKIGREVIISCTEEDN